MTTPPLHPPQREAVDALDDALNGAGADTAANASDAFATGINAATRFAERNTRGSVDTVKGGMFERIEAAKFNEAAVRAGATVRVRVTAEDGRPTAPEDLEYVRGAQVVGRVQAKMSGDAARAATMQSEEKYHGMQRLVPRDQAEAARDHAARRDDPHAQDAARRMTGALRHGRVSSGGTTHAEGRWATQHPSLYASLQKGRAMGVEALDASLRGAITSGLSAGLVTGVTEGVAVAKGQRHVGDAVMRTVGAAGRAAAGRAVSEAARVTARTVMREAGGEALAAGLSGAVLSSALVDAGSAVIEVVRGEIDMGSFGERVAGVALRSVTKALGVQAASALGASGLAASAIPCVTVFAAGLVLKSSLDILKEQRLAEAELKRVRVLCASAIAVLDAEEARNAAMCEAAEAGLQQVERVALDAMDALVSGGNPDHVVASLGEALGAMGRTLVFASQEDFDDFLDDPDATLIL